MFYLCGLFVIYNIYQVKFINFPSHNLFTSFSFECNIFTADNQNLWNYFWSMAEIVWICNIISSHKITFFMRKSDKLETLETFLSASDKKYSQTDLKIFSKTITVFLTIFHILLARSWFIDFIFHNLSKFLLFFLRHQTFDLERFSVLKKTFLIIICCDWCTIAKYDKSSIWFYVYFVCMFFFFFKQKVIV